MSREKVDRIKYTGWWRRLLDGIKINECGKPCFVGFGVKGFKKTSFNQIKRHLNNGTSLLLFLIRIWRIPGKNCHTCEKIKFPFACHTTRFRGNDWRVIFNNVQGHYNENDKDTWNFRTWRRCVDSFLHYFHMCVNSIISFYYK